MAFSAPHYRTEVKLECTTFVWEINHFDLLPHQNQQVFESPKYCEGKEKVEWILRLYPRGVRKDTSHNVALYLHLQSPGSAEFPIKVKRELSIFQSNQLLINLESSLNYTEGAMSWGFSNFIGRDQLLEACRSNNSFVIKCKLERVSTVTTDIGRIASVFNLDTHRLGGDSRQLLSGPGNFSDVTILVKDKQFPVHKCFLAARSPVFAAIFSREEFKGNHTNKIKIEDFEPDVIQGMLEFIYTDEVENLTGLANRLIGAARKYDLTRLRVMCEKALYDTINPQNAVEILELSNLYACQELTKCTVEFITDHFDEVVESDAYGKIKDPDLLRILMLSVHSNKKIKLA